MTFSSALDATVEESGVRFTYTVTNDGGEPVELSFRSGQSFDVRVEADGEEHWRYSDGKVFTQALRSETLEPDETVRYEATWTAPAAGEYEAHAVLACPDRTCEASAEISIG